MCFRYCKKSRFGVIHKIASAATMYMQINKTRGDILSFGIYFKGIGSFNVFFADGGDPAFSNKNTSFRNDFKRSDDFAVIYFQSPMIHWVSYFSLKKVEPKIFWMSIF